MPAPSRLLPALEGKAACGSAGTREQAVLPIHCSLQLSRKPLWLLRAGLGITEQGSAMGGGQGGSASCLFRDCLSLACSLGLEWFR